MLKAVLYYSDCYFYSYFNNLDEAMSWVKFYSKDDSCGELIKVEIEKEE